MRQPPPRSHRGRPHVRGQHQVPQCLRERPLPAHRASRHRRDARERGPQVPSIAAQAPRRPSGLPARRSARPGKRRLSSASNGATSTPLTRKVLSPSRNHGASMSAPDTSTPRITAPDRSAPTNRAPRRSAPTNSAPCRSSDRLKVATVPPRGVSRAGRSSPLPGRSGLRCDRSRRHSEGPMRRSVERRRR
jgi:hypothetical protein